MNENYSIALDVPRTDSADDCVYTFASVNEAGNELLVNLTNAHMNDVVEVNLQIGGGSFGTLNADTLRKRSARFQHSQRP